MVTTAGAAAVAAPETVATVLAEHYRDTYELTYRFWQQRNRLFLVLVGLVSAVSAVNAAPGQASLVVEWIVHLLGLPADRAKEVSEGFPVAVVHSAFSVLALYLMINLGHRSAYVLRNYRYLNKLEGELRSVLGVPTEAVALTREGGSYWTGRSFGQTTAKYAYMAVLLLLLATFFAGQLATLDHPLARAADVIFGIATGVYYLDYALTAVQLDRSP